MRAVMGLLAIWIAAGCGGAGAGPVAPTLAAIETLGLDCGDGVKDNVPSGLFQWSCVGTMDGEPTTILVDGNSEGVSQIALVLDASREPAQARRLFEGLVDTVPPLETAPILKTLVADWDGIEWSRTIGGVRVSASCDATQCSILVMPADDPLRPLPLP